MAPLAASITRVGLLTRMPATSALSLPPRAEVAVFVPGTGVGLFFLTRSVAGATSAFAFAARVTVDFVLIVDSGFADGSSMGRSRTTAFAGLSSRSPWNDG